MKKRYKITILLIGIFFIISLMIGLSYAYYIFSVSQSGTNAVRSDCFEITYTDGDAINLNNTISLTDEEAKELTPYHFTITNVCNSVMEYDVNIETLNNSTIDLNAVAVRLDNRKKNILGGIANNDSSLIVNNNASSSKSIYSEYLKAGESKTFDLRIWIDEDATIEQSANKSFSSKVVVKTSMVSNFKEATLISGPLFNKTIKQLAGDEPTQSDQNSWDSLVNGASYNPNDYPEDYSIYNYRVRDENIKTFAIANQAPSESDNAVAVSTNDSDEEILAWFDTDTIYLYTSANRIYMNENAAFSFYNLDGIQSLDLGIFNSSKTKDMSYMFQSIIISNSIDLSELDISNVENMSYMFQYSYLTDLDLSYLDTSKVTNMSYMFSYATMTNLNLNNLNNSNVKDMSHMFEQFHAFSSLDLSGFNTTSVEDMSQMFYRMSLNGLFSLDLSSFRTSNVIDMEYMFYGMNNLTSLDISNFDTSKVTNMSHMFGNLNIKILDLSSFDTSSVEDMSWMFYCLYNLETIYVGDNWIMENVTNDTAMTASLAKLVGGSGSTFGYSPYNREYARVDCGESSPGYFTYKGPLGDTASYCASLN